jgi:ubiquinol-cytochrome c reductase cytochrome b subunit
LHLALLHKDGSNNPLGINTNVDTVSFYPYFYVKDLFSFLVLVTVFSFFVFFYPNALGHSDNYIPANPLSTPAHIVPEWYFLPFYAILRSIPDKLGGVVAMISAILVLMLLPVLNTSSIRSSKFRPIFAVAFWFLVSDFLILGWIGQKPVESPYIEIGMGATIFYFTFILILVPLIGFIESSLIYNEDGLILSEKSTSIDNLDFNKHVLELESENVVNSAIFLSNKPIYSNIHTDVILYF